jgi:hypothetical protein
MKVEVLYFDGCPNHEKLLPRLHDLITGSGISADIELRAIEDDASAQREHFLGSPTVRVNGHDVEPGARERRGYGLECRLYLSSRGLSGMPDDELIRAALTNALAERS